MKSVAMLLLAGLLGGSVALAQPADDAAYQERHRIERARIAAERTRLEQRFTQEQAACQHRFAVTDCVNASRAARQQGLAELQRQQNLLSDEERRRRAGERLQRLEHKADAHAEDRATRPVAPERQSKVPPRPPVNGKLPGTKEVPQRDLAREAQHEHAMERRQQEHAQDNARRAAQAASAAEEQRRFEAKQREAADYKARVLQREADKPSTAMPLPPPPQ